MDEMPNINEVLHLIRTTSANLVDGMRLIHRLFQVLTQYDVEQLAKPVQQGDNSVYTNGTPQQWADIFDFLKAWEGCVLFLANGDISAFTKDHMIVINKFLPLEKRGPLL